MNYLIPPPLVATTRSSLDRNLPVTLLMKLGVMAAQVALTCSFSSAMLGDLSLHKTPSLWSQILISRGAQFGLEGQRTGC